MATNRKLTFVDGYVYHVFNRGIDKRNVFRNFKEYSRFVELIDYYRHKDTPMSYSKLLQLPLEIRAEILNEVDKSECIISILSFCMMPNHFHFMLQQKSEKGVATFISNITNAYTKYFNT